MTRLPKKTPQFVISILFIVGYFITLGLFLSGIAKPDPEYQELVKSLITVLTAVVLLIAQFWIGSSAGSKDKDDPKPI